MRRVREVLVATFPGLMAHVVSFAAAWTAWMLLGGPERHEQPHASGTPTAAREAATAAWRPPRPA